MVVENVSTASLLQILVSVLLPIVVAFVTKQQTLGKVKAFVLLGLSAVTSIAFAASDAANTGTLSDFDWKTAVLGAVVTFVIASASHIGIWKPSEVSGSNGLIQNKTPNFGL